MTKMMQTKATPEMKANTKHATIESSMTMVATMRTFLNMSFHCRLNPLRVSQDLHQTSCVHEESRADQTENAADGEEG